MEPILVTVSEVLKAATSQDLKTLKLAEEKLKEWEVEPCFYTALLNITSNLSVDINIRLMAILYIKNGIQKYWTKNAPYVIPEEEKQTLKQGLLTSFNEPVNQIALQKAHLISIIAKMDCPTKWPELYPTLLSALESTDGIIQHRSLLTLYYVVKAIASKRTMSETSSFHEFTLKVFSFMLNLWIKYTNLFVRDIFQNSTTPELAINMEKSVLSLKILRQLTAFGFCRNTYKLREDKDCVNFMREIFMKARTVMSCRKHLKDSGSHVLELCEKFITNLTKVLVSVLESHPIFFIDFIQPTLELTFYYLFTEEGVSMTFERFAVQCFNLIKIILTCTEYKPGRIKARTSRPETLQAHEIKQQFFKGPNGSDMCRKMVGHYFTLTQDELTSWDTDPEEFFNDENDNSSKYGFRFSMHTMFVTMLRAYKESLTPAVLEMISATNALVDPEDIQGILKKDAVYNAVTLCSFYLNDDINFEQWLTNTLYQELQIKHHNYRVIRRRVVSMIGRWTVINHSKEFDSTLHQTVNKLLASDEDMVVRLTAATTLGKAIEGKDLQSEQFKARVLESFNLVFTLLKETRECETKMAVLNVMILLLKHMGSTSQLQLNSLLQYLPFLWQESENHIMLRCAVVTALKKLVRAQGVNKSELTSFLLPIIELGTDPTQSSILHMLRDSLELWMIVLEGSSTMTNELMCLFKNMPSLLQYSSENILMCLSICVSHVLLAPELVMRTNGMQVIQVFDSLMSDLKLEEVFMLTRLVKIYMLSSLQLGMETVFPILPRIFEKIYSKEENLTLMSKFLCIMARVLLSSHDIFTKVLTNIALTHNESGEVTFGKILDVWLSAMRNITEHEQLKLLGLAFTNLLTTQSEQVLERFEPIISYILQIMGDISKLDRNGTRIDSLIFRCKRPTEFKGVGQSKQMKINIFNDPVYTIELKDYLQSQLFALKNQVGVLQYQQLLQKIDGEKLGKLRDFITL